MLLLKNSSSTLTGRNVRLSNLLISSCRILALTGWERNCPGNVLQPNRQIVYIATLDVSVTLCDDELKVQVKT